MSESRQLSRNWRDIYDRVQKELRAYPRDPETRIRNALLLLNDLNIALSAASETQSPEALKAAYHEGYQDALNDMKEADKHASLSEDFQAKHPSERGGCNG